MIGSLPIVLLLAAFLSAQPLAAVELNKGDVGYAPIKENLQSRQWFQDAKFGLFVHWGVYSVPGRGEWVMNNEKISVSEYEKFAP